MEDLESKMRSMGMGGRNWELVNDEEKTIKLVTNLMELPEDNKRIYLDFEGVNLCRMGNVAIGQLTYPADGDKPMIYLLDFIALPEILEVNAGDSSLRSIFEDHTYQKFIFDPRCDSDCLFHTKDRVHMKNVICLQLCEVAKDRAMGCERRLVNGLKRVLETYIPSHLRTSVGAAKQKGIDLFAPERGGSYSVFTARTLLADIIAYCLIDIAFFELLEAKLFVPLSQRSKDWVKAQSVIRVNVCLGPRSAQEGGKLKAIAPLGP